MKIFYKINKPKNNTLNYSLFNLGRLSMFIELMKRDLDIELTKYEKGFKENIQAKLYHDDSFTPILDNAIIMKRWFSLKKMLSLYGNILNDIGRDNKQMAFLRNSLLFELSPNLNIRFKEDTEILGFYFKKGERLKIKLQFYNCNIPKELPICKDMLGCILFFKNEIFSQLLLKVLGKIPFCVDKSPKGIVSYLRGGNWNKWKLNMWKYLDQEKQAMVA